MNFTVGQTVKASNKNYTIKSIEPSKENLAKHQIAKGFAPFNFFLTRIVDGQPIVRLAQFSVKSQKFV